MGKQKFTAEQIIAKLHEADVLQSQGKTVAEAVRQIGISDMTYYKWRKAYGGLRVDQAQRLKELEQENQRLRKVVADQTIDISILKEAAPGKLLSPAKKRRAVREIQEETGHSERRVCKVLEQPRSTQRLDHIVSDLDAQITKRIVSLATDYGRYGYRRITAMLRNEGWRVNHKRVERIWRLEGLKVPQKQPKRRRLWLNDGSCIRLRPTQKNHVWSYDFVADRTSEGRKMRMLNIIDEYTRECLSIRIERKITANDVIETLKDLFITRGVPEHIRSDNGPEFVADILRQWLQDLQVKTLLIEPGSPWENGYIESFNGKLRDELLNGEIFDTLTEARVVTERWRKFYNTQRIHSSLGYKPPAPKSCYQLRLANA
ncbi:MAG: IS3 family transposase [Bacteroidota bacterium]